jgi:methionyl-tRNA formyltransferase
VNIVFMGTPEFAVPAFQALLGSDHRVRAVFCQPDRPSGRRRKISFGPVKRLAKEAGLPVHQPLRLRRNEEDRERLASLDLDAVVVVAYGLLLPPEVLAIPRLGCINVHASLLPLYRGAAPIQHALLNGEQETGVTTMLIDKGLDTGAILLQRRIPLGPRVTAPELSGTLASLGAGLLLETLSGLEQGTVEARPQDDRRATLAPLLRKEDGLICWDRTAREVDQQVRALNPWPGTYTFCGASRLRVLAAQPLDQPETPAGVSRQVTAPGQVLGRHRQAFLVACGGGTVLQVLAAQPANRSAMDGCSCLNGRSVSKGQLLSGDPLAAGP